MRGANPLPGGRHVPGLVATVILIKVIHPLGHTVERKFVATLNEMLKFRGDQAAAGNKCVVYHGVNPPAQEEQAA